MDISHINIKVVIIRKTKTLVEIFNAHFMIYLFCLKLHLKGPMKSLIMLNTFNIFNLIIHIFSNQYLLFFPSSQLLKKYKTYFLVPTVYITSPPFFRTDSCDQQRELQFRNLNLHQELGNYIS